MTFFVGCSAASHMWTSQRMMWWCIMCGQRLL